TARRPRKWLRRTRSARRSHEYLGTLHRAADRDRTADGRPVARRPRGLSAAADRGVAERELSDPSGHRAAAWRRSADHGLFRGDAAPPPMASSVATPLEPQFGQIPGLTQMTSSSALGYTQITLQFDLSRQLDGAVSDTLSAINAASSYLPPNLPYPPTINKVNPADTPILVLAATSDTLPLTTVDAYAENILLQKISQISG